MFTRLREFARNFFRRQTTVYTDLFPIITVVEQTSNHKLVVKASQEMVKTRAQDHGLGGTVVGEKVDGLKNGKKRKSGSVELSKEREATSTTMRRRLNYDKEVESGIEKPSPLWNSGDDLGSQSSNAFLQPSEQSTVRSQSPLFDSKTALNNHVPKTPSPSQPSVDEPSVTTQPLKDSVEGTHLAVMTHNMNTETITRSNIGKKRRKGDNAAHTLTDGHARTARSVMQIKTHGKDSKPELKRATHKRFGNEDALVPLDLPSNNAIQDQTLDDSGTNKVQLDDEDESEDDSPEVVTVSAGLKQARAAAAEAAKAGET